MTSRSKSPRNTAPLSLGAAFDKARETFDAIARKQAEAAAYEREKGHAKIRALRARVVDPEEREHLAEMLEAVGIEVAWSEEE